MPPYHSNLDDFRQQSNQVCFFDREHFVGAIITSSVVYSKWAWTLTDQAGGTETIIDSAGGVVRLLTSVTNEIQRAGICWADKLTIPHYNGTAASNKGPVCRWRMRVKTGTAVVDTATLFSMGFATARNNDIEAIATHALWSLRGLATGVLNIYAESDDGTTDVAPTDTGFDFVLDEWHTFEIDASDYTNIRFRYDGQLVCATTTFTWAANTSNLQLLAEIQKNSADVLDIEIDSVELGFYNYGD